VELVGQVGHGPWWPSACRCTSSRLNHTAQVEQLHDLGYSDRELADVVGMVTLNVLTGAFNLVTGSGPART
jgi:hypothetical protein